MPLHRCTAATASCLAGVAMVILPLWLHAAEPAGSGPTVAQLLAACERGQAAGDVGVDAALCEWYAVPCDCDVKRPAGSPRWCLPAEESVDVALPRVLEALRADPRQSAPAAAVVPEVMARLYPCAGAAVP